MFTLWTGIIILTLIALSFISVPLLRVRGGQGHTVIQPKSEWLTVILLSLIMVFFALGIYWQYGSSGQLSSWYQQTQTAAAAQKLQTELTTPQQVIAALQQHLQKNPQSARGWYLLGRLYLSQQQFKTASQAFARAYSLQPSDPEILFQYAQALYLVQHSLNGKPAQLLKELLRLQPDNDMAINLLGVDAFAQGNYQQAIQYWEKILPHYASDSPDGQALLNAIARAQQALVKNKRNKNAR